MYSSRIIAHSNDELIDMLKTRGYIDTELMEHLLRVVDRRDYFPPGHKEMAYRDCPWEHGYIHMSSPSMYSQVICKLHLYPGLSFLNIGSGTGYLSTIAGLLLTQNGINHGIELDENCVNYAYERLEQFKKESLALDEFDFCEPHFMQGNCLNLIPSRQYDRVYCGAECPETRIAFIKQFVGIGGILVMPVKYFLIQYHKISEETWLENIVLPVLFAPLVEPVHSESYIQLPQLNPLSLMELCRRTIRNRLIVNIRRSYQWDVEFMNLSNTYPIFTSKLGTYASDKAEFRKITTHNYSRYYLWRFHLPIVMNGRIHSLPLPVKLKMYINYNRDL